MCVTWPTSEAVDPALVVVPYSNHTDCSEWLIQINLFIYTYIHTYIHTYIT